ncbi:threonine/homoserine efflux transporter RhtA [Thermolongibacillus altinsuensis]|uniref:Threonine/homoserine efflux transporter RhtA n=1 Tax=Thermolongibacillus altinsuensis TaxID=575256 RepID=A0A4R1QCL7_9BACL|nr:EamA family transporter [Thermolongibacillus altinsuensis]TCL48412.1 threonine/homoserine efflux transporter RhtA [Thermolongibacillus altinsuensis]GMB08044.1 transporter [Thermolongibacillus altinsuensis]
MSTRTKGLWMVLIASTLWGVSGTAAQVLFQEKEMTADGLVVIRMLVAGILLLLMAAWKGISLLAIWRKRESRLRLLLFSIFGMLGVQYTYFASIETGNAATATLLQYLAPVYIVVYSLMKEKRKPSKPIWFAVGFALIGTFLLLTNGAIEGLSVSFISFIWGILSGIALAFYTLTSAALLKNWSSFIVVGWGMVIGGGVMGLFSSSWLKPSAEWGLDTFLLIIFVIVFGTLLAFLLFIESIRHLSPTESSILSSFEPLSAVITSIVFLHVSFGFFQAIGGVLIILTVFVLSKGNRSSSEIL